MLLTFIVELFNAKFSYMKMKIHLRYFGNAMDKYLIPIHGYSKTRYICDGWVCGALLTTVTKVEMNRKPQRIES